MKDQGEDKLYRELPTWMEWLRKALPLEGVAIRAIFEPREKKIWRKAIALAEYSPFKEAIKTLQPIGEDSEAAAIKGDLLKRIVSVRKEYYETRDLSVSALLKYEECPGCYFDIHEMRAPDQWNSEIEEELEGGERALVRREFGNLFHRIMQHFDLENPLESELARRLSDDASSFVSARDREKLEQSVRNFFKSEWGKFLHAKDAEIYREVPFIYKLSRGELRGKIDLVLKNPDGGIVILDYKTNRIENETELFEKAGEYELQIMIYALAVWETTGILPEKGALYFTSLDRTLDYNLTEELLVKTREKTSHAVEEIALHEGPFTHKEGCPRVCCPS